jgi:hypothetical protein
MLKLGDVFQIRSNWKVIPVGNPAQWDDKTFTTNRAYRASQVDYPWIKADEFWVVTEVGASGLQVQHPSYVIAARLCDDDWSVTDTLVSFYYDSDGYFASLRPSDIAILGHTIKTRYDIEWDVE